MSNKSEETKTTPNVNSVGFSELLAELKSHYRQLAPHMMNRQGSILIKQSIEMMEGMRASIKEVSDDHKHQISPCYNECDKDPCSWCEEVSIYLS